MTTAVADRTSNKEEQIVHAAEVIGRSKYRARVFQEVYRGKKSTKTIEELITLTKFKRTRLLDAGKALADQDLVTQSKADGRTAYSKVAFFQRHRDRVLRLASNRKAREAVPTKRKPRASAGVVRLSVQLKLPKTKVDARRITVDDIDSFSAVRRQKGAFDFVKIPEATFKRGVARILGEKGDFKDWGGELRDLSSTKLRIAGQRRAVAFAFKGPGKTGRLVPGKMGKNGDQIQRLARCPADVFIVQYWGEIDDSVVEQLESFMRLRAYFEGRSVWYGVIDGSDSARLMAAYSSKFGSERRKKNGPVKG